MKGYLLGSVLLALLALITACSPRSVDGTAAQYIQHTDKITLGAGNAQAVNAINNTIDPWPPGVSNRRIPANGERMVNGIVRYRTPSQQRSTIQSGQPAPSGASAPATESSNSSGSLR